MSTTLQEHSSLAGQIAAWFADPAARQEPHLLFDRLQLARAEARAALVGAIVTRFPGLELDGDRVEYLPIASARQLAALPVR